MRILIIQPWIRVGGAELISIHLAYELRQLGHEVAVVSSFVDLTAMPDQAHAVKYLLPPAWLASLCQRSRLVFFLIGPWILLALVWKHSGQAHLLNPHNFPASWIAVLVGSLRRIPVVWTCSEPPERLSWRDALNVGIGDFLGWLVASSWIDRALVRRVGVIHVPSYKTEEDVFRRYGHEATVIHTSVDPIAFSTGSSIKARSKLGLGDKLVLLCVGKLHPQKNQILCIEALRELILEIPDALLLLVGDGPMRRPWLQQAQAWGLSKNVLFLGQVPSDELPDLYAACSVNLFPPKNQSWGLTPFEALCAERISVVSTECGAAEILGREEIGIVCEPTTEAFVKAVHSIHDDPSAYSSMAKRGRKFVIEHLSHRNFAEQMVTLMASSRNANNEQ